jgi:NADH:ubiquinone oxidoreductase subunit 6 (subunit J)
MSLDQIIQVLVFILLTGLTLGGGLGVVTSRNLFRGALYLITSLIGVVGYYILLDAGFLAVIQLLVYIGAISILFLFAIMLSRSLMADTEGQRNEQWWVAALVVVLVFVVLVAVVWHVAWPVADPDALASPSVSIARMGEVLVGPYMLPFEAVSVLLLGALIGAVLLARDILE